MEFDAKNGAVLAASGLGVSALMSLPSRDDLERDRQTARRQVSEAIADEQGNAYLNYWITARAIQRARMGRYPEDSELEAAPGAPIDIPVVTPFQAFQITFAIEGEAIAAEKAAQRKLDQLGEIDVQINTAWLAFVRSFEMGRLRRETHHAITLDFLTRGGKFTTEQAEQRISDDALAIQDAYRLGSGEFARAGRPMLAEYSDAMWGHLLTFASKLDSAEVAILTDLAYEQLGLRRPPYSIAMGQWIGETVGASFLALVQWLTESFVGSAGAAARQLLASLAVPISGAVILYGSITIAKNEATT